MSSTILTLSGVGDRPRIIRMPTFRPQQRYDYRLRDPEAPATRREARGAAPVGAGLVTHLGVQVLRSACAGRRRQAAAPPRCGSGARVYAVASGPPVPGCVAEPVSGLAPTAARLCARRSVVLSSHVAASTDLAEVQAIRDMVTSPEYRHVPTGTLAILSHRLGTVSAAPSTWYGLVRKIRLATPSAPGASGQAKGWAAHDGT